jgi:ribokinase
LTDVRILVVGGASLDSLDDTDNLVAGGAGMYTAMASHASGANVTLFAPRPEPMPEALEHIAASVTWLGPSVSPDELAHFEITYRDGRTTYLTANFGAEESLSPDELPADLSSYDCVHLIPLGDIARQREFLLACRDRGARRVSAGTALDLINAQPDDALAILEAADLYFMNEAEAQRLFGSLSAVCTRPGQFIFVTRGSDGVTIVQGDMHTHLRAAAATVVDATGAGDTFCGATLVSLAQGHHPATAARRAIPLSARMTEEVGPTVLLRPAPITTAAADPAVTLNQEQIRHVGDLVAGLPEAAPFPFTGPDLPPPHHPATLDYFFVTTLQQFGFWHLEGEHYSHPLVATVDSEERKGAFYLFRAYLRWLEQAPEMLSPARQAELTEAELLELLRADDGTDPMPALDMHLALGRQYGQDMLALGLTPRSMVDQANASGAPLHTLLSTLDHIGGYKEDPLRKKSALLAMVLRQRPEAFLADCADDIPPVIDYHVMRSCLRIGLIDINDDALAGKLERREVLSEDEEWAVRSAAHSAIAQLVAESGASMGAVDWFFFQARKRCPEMTQPQCSACSVDPLCAHRKELFQPVRRTSFY